jgi:hypothetical protein
MPDRSQFEDEYALFGRDLAARKYADHSAAAR